MEDYLIYILYLEDIKWYVGKTKDIETRIKAHLDGTACQWTKLHRMIDLHMVYSEVDAFDEDKITKQYMAMYGIDNVRGGSYTQTHLDTNQKKFLQRELWSAADKCLGCGGDHFIKVCPAAKH